MGGNITVSKARLVAVLGDHILVLEKPDGTYSLPGGRIKKNETGVQALIREVKEETSLIINKRDLAYLSTEVKKKSNKTVHKSYYLYQRKAGVPKNLESEKFKSVAWCLWFHVSEYMDDEDQKAILSFFSKQQLIN